MELRVLHLSGSKAGQEEVFQSSVVRLGREPSNDIAFDPYQDIVVSGRHAELTFDGRDWTVRDLGSSNGTYIGGERVSIRALRSGENVQLGRGGPRLEIRFTTADVIPSTTMEDLPPRDFPQTVVLGADDMAAARDVTLIGPDAPDTATLRQQTVDRLRFNALPPAIVAPVVRASAVRRSPGRAIGIAAVAAVVAVVLFLALRPKTTTSPKVAPPSPPAYASRAELDKLRTDLAAREAQLNDLQQRVRATPPEISVFASSDLDRQVRSAQATIESLRTQLEKKDNELSKQAVNLAQPTQDAQPAEETFDVVARAKTFRKRLHVSADESAAGVPGNVAGDLARSLGTVLATTGRYVIDPDSGSHVSIGVLSYQAARNPDQASPSGLGKFRGRVFGRKRPANTSAGGGAYDVALTASVGVYDATGRQLGSSKPRYALSDTRAAENRGGERIDTGQVINIDTPLADTVRYVIAASADEVMNATEALEPEITVRSTTGDSIVLDAGRNIGVAPDDVFEVTDGERVVARARVESVQEATAIALVRPSNVSVAGKRVRYVGVKRGERSSQTSGIADRVARARQTTEAREGPGTSFKIAGSVPAGAELRIVYTVGSWSRVRIGERTIWVPTAAIDV